MKKILYIVCLVLVAVFSICETAKATTYSNNIPLSAYRDDDLQVAPIEINSLPIQRSNMESSYISPYVTSVKNQNPYGTCWAFSCISASEASLIQEGLARKDELDLSEWHLLYFLSHSVTDPLGGTVGDSLAIVDGDYLNAGGNQQFATYRVANWYGLVDEETAPYASLVDSDGTAVLPDEIAYSKNVAHLENAYWISMQDQNTVKQLIKKYGACGAAYCSENIYYSSGSATAWNTEEEIAFYCPDDMDTNHGITIVGWDDNYSKDNFGMYKPESDGAWYCKNSWGADWSRDGYFWISYEDVPLHAEEAFFYDYGSKDNYDHNYQYDGGAWAGHSYTCNYAANVYTAQQDEYLKAVGFYTRNSNYKCKVEIYKITDAENPTSGELVAEKVANQLYAGFHTVELNEPVKLKANESFSVVIYQEDAFGEAVRIVIDSEYDGEDFVNRSSATSGQSFILMDGQLWDISEYGDNCRIKAYTDDRIPVTDLDLSDSELTLYVNDTAILKANISPSDASDKSLSWLTNDEDIATVDADGRIVAKKAGETMITCISNDNNEIKEQCKIVVKQQVTGMKLNYRNVEIVSGESLQLKAIISPHDATNQNVVWKSSDKGVATISENGKVTTIGAGTATITCIAEDRNECMAMCSISVYEEMIDISLNPSNVTLDIGQSVQLQAITNPAIERTKGVYWISADESVVTIDKNGRLTALAFGNDVEVRCIAKDGTGVKAVCNVSVGEKTITYSEGTELSDSSTNIKYKVIKGGKTDATVQFVDGNGCKGTVTIPATVEIDGVTYKITSIAANAFRNNKKITKLVMGNNITSIGKNAFYGCSKLTVVTIGNKVKTIGDNAFYKCSKLKKLTIGSNVTTIGNKAFYQCSNLTKITIPSKVNQIGKQAFYKCKRLKSITINTSKLTSKKVGNNVLKGIHSKATIKVPKKKLSYYKKMLKAKGIGKFIKVKSK